MRLMDGRDLMCGAALTALLATIGSGVRRRAPRRWRGRRRRSDRLAVRVLVDSYQFAVAPGRKVGSVELVHFGWGIGPDKPPGKTLISEFGLPCMPSRSAARKCAMFWWISAIRSRL